MRVLIAEDDVLIGENLSIIVNSKGYRVAGIIQTMAEFNLELEKESFDMVLLDIRMNGKDLGCDMARELKGKEIPFVFVTSFSDKNTLKNAVSCQPFGYILKPFDRSEIDTILDEIAEELATEIVWVKSAGEDCKIKIKDVKYMCSENVYVTVFSVNDRIVVRAKITDLTHIFSQDVFIRTHQSYVVNLSFVVKRLESELIMDDGFVVPISRKYQKAVREALLKSTKKSF